MGNNQIGIPSGWEEVAAFYLAMSAGEWTRRQTDDAIEELGRDCKGVAGPWLCEHDWTVTEGMADA